MSGKDERGSYSRSQAFSRPSLLRLFVQILAYVITDGSGAFFDLMIFCFIYTYLHNSIYTATLARHYPATLLRKPHSLNKRTKKKKKKSAPKIQKHTRPKSSLHPLLKTIKPPLHSPPLPLPHPHPHDPYHLLQTPRLALQHASESDQPRRLVVGTRTRHSLANGRV